MFRCVFVAVVLCLAVAGNAYSEENQPADVNAIMNKIVEQTIGRGSRIIRIEPAEDSPVANWKQTRVWIASLYGETPVLFYTSGDGKLIFAGTIFNDSGENLTRKAVGETIPKFIDNKRMQVNEDYRIGSKEAKVNVVLWIGADPYSKGLFEFFYDLYKRNKDSVALYLKFYPRSEQDVEKMKAVTCFRGEALADALKTVYAAAPGWGGKEELDNFKKTGDSKMCNDELVHNDLKLAVSLELPIHPVAFVNNTLLLEKATEENVKKLSGIDLH